MWLGLTLLADIRLGCKSLLGTNTLAYWVQLEIMNLCKRPLGWCYKPYLAVIKLHSCHSLIFRGKPQGSLPMWSSKELKLKGRVLYDWPPYLGSLFVLKSKYCFQSKQLIWTSLYKEVNCTEPSTSVRFPGNGLRLKKLDV